MRCKLIGRELHCRTAGQRGQDGLTPRTVGQQVVADVASTVGDLRHCELCAQRQVERRHDVALQGEQH